jgi:hypothetical protein
VLIVANLVLGVGLAISKSQIKKLEKKKTKKDIGAGGRTFSF